MKRKLGAVLFVIYSIIAIAVTVLLLSFNQYNCSEIGDYTFYIVNNDAFEPQYKEGSILIIKKTNDKHVNVGDEMFLYKVINSQEFEVVNARLLQKIQQGRHIVYSLDNGESYATDYFIGKADDTIVIEGWGTLLAILESKWGYLFCIVIVSLLLFLQEVFDLIIELKYGGDKATNPEQAASQNATQNAATTAKKVNTTTKKVSTATKKVATVANTNTEIQTGEKEG